MIGTLATLAAVTGVPAAARPAGGVTTQVDAGDSHSCARGRDGRAYCWGDGSSGQLGNGDVVRHSSPVAVTAPAGVSFTQLTAGYRQTCGLGSDARAYCWGSNYSGELGNGDNTNRSTPVAVKSPAAGVSFTQLTAGYSHTCGLGGDARAYCWGAGSLGELGDGASTSRSTPVAVRSPVSFTQVSAGISHTCGLGGDARAYCWGSGLSGELGNGDTRIRSTPVAVTAPAPGVTFTRIAAGFSNACGLGSDSRAYCWGSGGFGQLGDGASTDRSTPVAVKSPVTFTQISPGVHHTCGLGGDARAYCWGDGSSGQLGDGETTNRSTPVAVTAPAPGVNFTRISAGSGFTCGLGSDARTYCWGANRYHQLGHGDIRTHLTPVAVRLPKG
ncbi:RCC1 domain-containing protein [Actinoplanes sp. NPDC049668]|uniref:RCC1 domain-containing protein n=1 Tax=unclassified Actinoplanes TaxID=2626549 RepID=UPI0033B82BE5